MGEIVNLRRARKRRAAAEAEAAATANRTASGVTKIMKAQARAERGLADRRLDGLRRPERRDAD
jgi:hypothetical protein